MKCPRCNEKLLYSEIDGERIGTCMSCSGMWLNKNQLNKILNEIGGNMESCSIDDKPHSDEYPPIKCLRCDNTEMKKINFLDYSNIILDYCEKCGGFWVDKGELSKMKDYVHKMEEGSHDVRDKSAYHLLVRMSEMAFSIFK